MKPDDFEKQLQRQPLRRMPAEWRAEILEAADGARTQDASVLTPRFVSSWREWLWPCPQAWAGLAALWMIIVGLNLTAPTGPGAMAMRGSEPSSEVKTSLAAQRRELARLLDSTFFEPAPAPKSPPGPRSEGPSPSKV